jgi:hypothetical protein
VELWCRIYTVGDEIDNLINAPQLNRALDREIASGIPGAHIQVDEACRVSFDFFIYLEVFLIGERLGS